MLQKAPHLEDEETPENTFQGKNSKFGRQGPSKYGKGGARAHKAKKRSERAKR